MNMENNTQSPREIWIRRLTIVGIAVVILAVVAVGTVFVLKSLVPKKISSSIMSVSADETVALYGAPGAITGLSENLYEQQVYDGSSIPVIYKTPERSFAVSTLTSQNVLFYSKSKSAQNDIQAIQQQTDTFMKAKGYQRVANSTDSKSTGVQYATFVSDAAVCQLISSSPSSSQPDTEIPVSHQLACAEKQAISDEYVQTDKLLKLYSGKQLPSYTSVTRTVVTEGDKSFATLSLRNKTKSPMLLFAAVHDQWSFIADLNGSTGESNSKYVITPDIKTKLGDPKYGGFLMKYIVGTSS